MLPSRSTAIVMFSGFVCVGMLTAFGRSTFTVLLMTGIVMRKMMSNTSMTSTSGVVLITDITPRSSSPDDTLIAICAVLDSLLAYHRSGRRSRPRCLGLGTADPCTTDKIGMEIGGEVPQRILDELVAAEQPVVAHHRRYRDEQADRGHDQRLTHRSCDLVDARLTGDTDRHERIQNAPHRAEQSDEGRDRAHGRE